MNQLITENIVQWLAGGERGTSSNTIVQALTGLKCEKYGTSHPLDPSDLRRCMLLLEACPELRPLMPLMAKVSPQWAALVAEWDDLIALLKREIASGGLHAPAHATYDRMKAMGC